MTFDFTWIDGIRYAVLDPQLVRYELPETPAQRKARGDGDAPTVSYTVATIERVSDE